MTPIIIQFNPTGPSDIDVQAVCEGWQDSYSVEYLLEDYILNLKSHGCNKGLLRTVIATDKAQEIIKRVGLVKVASDMIVGGYDYLTVQSIKAEISTLSELLTNCEDATDKEFIKYRKTLLEKALNNNHSITHSLNHK